MAKSEKTLQLLSCSLGSRDPGGETLKSCCEAAQTALRRPPCDEEVPSLAHSHVEGADLESGSPSPGQASLDDAIALDNTPDCSVVGGP